MKTLDHIKSFKSDCLDGRDLTRLANFLPVSDWPAIGLTAKEGADLSAYVPDEWTRENVLKQLASDLAFGFEKALNQRGISASLMYSVVKMWMWVLDDELADGDGYAQYGLPFFKSVAEKYGLPNPIGEDAGDEAKYSAEGS